MFLWNQKLSLKMLQTWQWKWLFSFYWYNGVVKHGFNSFVLQKENIFCVVIYKHATHLCDWEWICAWCMIWHEARCCKTGRNHSQRVTLTLSAAEFLSFLMTAHDNVTIFWIKFAYELCQIQGIIKVSRIHRLWVMNICICTNIATASAVLLINRN